MTLTPVAAVMPAIGPAECRTTQKMASGATPSSAKVNNGGREDGASGVDRGTDGSDVGRLDALKL